MCITKCHGISDIQGILNCDKDSGCKSWEGLKPECLICAGAKGARYTLQCTDQQHINVAGNMILSKYPITKAESTFFVSDKQANRQGKLIVEVCITLTSIFLCF